MDNRRVHIRRETDFESCPRYDKHELTEEQMLDIAKRAVLLAREEFYRDVGKSVANKFFIVVGLVTLAGLTWLTNHGWLK